MKIGFLFNHEAAHQVAHGLPIAISLASHYPQIEVQILFSPGAVETEVLRNADKVSPNVKFIRLRSAWTGAKTLTRASGSSIPFNLISALHRNLDQFRSLTALVVPEKTSLLLKTCFGLRQLKMIHTRHGAGDRAVGFDKASGRFDFVLLSGQKIRDRLAAAGQLRQNGYAIVGYPKFDLSQSPGPKKWFSNCRKTVLYNPHPSVALSSWYRDGPYILDYFAKNPDYNLIFAPHVMLFAKRFNISLSPLALGLVPPVPLHILNASNIHIDLGSTASIDMTYTDAADIYLGDASSQVYEFIRTPRPCIFFNSHGHSYNEDPNFAHWAAGAVVENIVALEKALADAMDRPNAFECVQKQLFSYSFDISNVPSADRAANAIASFVAA